MGALELAEDVVEAAASSSTEEQIEQQTDDAEPSYAPVAARPGRDRRSSTFPLDWIRSQRMAQRYQGTERSCRTTQSAVSYTHLTLPTIYSV